MRPDSLRPGSDLWTAGAVMRPAAVRAAGRVYAGAPAVRRAGAGAPGGERTGAAERRGQLCASGAAAPPAGAGGRAAG